MNGLNGLGKQVQRLEDAAPKPVEPVDALDRMSEEELSLYLIQHRIESALERGDEVRADKWRRLLTDEREQIIEQFLAIDEMSIPHAESGQARRVQEGHIIYSLSRVMYRSDRGRIERHRDRLFIDDYETIFRWLEVYAKEGA